MLDQELLRGAYSYYRLARKCVSRSSSSRRRRKAYSAPAVTESNTRYELYGTRLRKQLAESFEQPHLPTRSAEYAALLAQYKGSRMPKTKRDANGLPIPNAEGVKPQGNQYKYLDLPSSMDSCFYEVTLTETGETDTGKYFFKFQINETDTNLKGEASVLLDPQQQFAETYFWNGLFGMVAALRGQEPTEELFTKMMENYANILKKAVAGKFNGKRARLSIEAYTGKKDGKRKTQKVWEPSQYESDDE